MNNENNCSALIGRKVITRIDLLNAWAFMIAFSDSRSRTERGPCVVGVGLVLQWRWRQTKQPPSGRPRRRTRLGWVVLVAFFAADGASLAGSLSCVFNSSCCCVCIHGVPNSSLAVKLLTPIICLLKCLKVCVVIHFCVWTLCLSKERFLLFVSPWLR